MLENSRLSVVFITRKLNLEKGSVRLYARVTIDGKRAEFSLNRELSVSLWDEKRKRGRGHSKYVISLNKYLDQVFTGLHEAHRQLLQEDADISSKAVKARFLKEDDRGKTLLDLIAYHNSTMANVLRPGTMKNYYSTERCIKKFLEEKLKIDDITLKKLNYGFIVDFEQYVRKYKPSTRMGCANNGAMKHMERLKKMSRLGVRLEWLEKDPFVNFKLRFEKTNRQFLTERDLQLIEQTTFKKSSTEQIKDLFIFACYTGLSFVDVEGLRVKHLVKGIDGNYWLYTKRTKTDEPLRIPLLPKALEIIEKYSTEPRIVKRDGLLPRYSNQMINRTLKEIADACDIHKKMTFHTARHTFATSVTLSNGVPIETVSRLLGHTKLSTTQVYARVLEKKVGEDMRNLMDVMESKIKKQTDSRVIS